jgi:NDP-sugar pyrophosphorylase family protein
MTERCIGVILAGGLENRFAATGMSHSKALTPILNVPLLKWHVCWLRPHVTEIRVHCGEREDVKQATKGVQGVLPIFGGPVGTAVSVQRTLASSGATSCIVVNGDTINDLNIAEVLKAKASCGTSAMVAVTRFSAAQNPNALLINSANRVVYSTEAIPKLYLPDKVEPVEAVASTGVYCLSDIAISEVSSNAFISMESQFVPYLIKHRRLRAFDNTSRFSIDIGTVEGMKKLQAFRPAVENFLLELAQRSFPL